MCEVFRLYHKRLIAFIRIYTRNLEAAEEVAQEVFLDAYNQRKEIRKASGLRPWLFTVGKRKAIRLMQRKDQSLVIAFDQEQLEEFADGHCPTQDRDLRIKQSGSLLQEAISGLKPRDRELVALRFFGGLQMNEISETMNIPIGSVGVFLNRSLEKIRNSLACQGIRPEDLME
ncbi:MAG: sigma-70 family RNA polymerase sigma factor [Candidatus Omnitrophica bacterium]|nr:sigma-70 family RNA polymerase sigma factor [Candidatus Omnitrophota bacterium]MCA9429829.1 sigma-70 family RNA polymerase sigma factor [Candidatus Omnitrophota bacterium]MCB9768322.1 sigma-70 family RNA polymerase sigma factor [Candidatus Omnitrophota bacterium]